MHAAAPGLPVAIVCGTPLHRLPQDLYIPPDALLVFLETFEGPLDLLLYLIRRQNLDILDIPIAAVTEQYMAYVELMRALRLDLAAEYLVMAALLAEIKSRMLLPRPAEVQDEEQDPRAELVRQLQEYERFKQAAVRLDELSRMERDVFAVQASAPSGFIRRPLPVIDVRDLLLALDGVLRRAELYAHHRVEREPLSVRERMTRILDHLGQRHLATLSELLDPHEGRAGVVVTILALLELIKEQVLELIQTTPFNPLQLRLRAGIP
ncbi:segregation/condensation protein A [Caldichromatium japonicum]|uniref:Segregation and condensation protein A n=1 Tax=Caldichromatium japonicum TaxID=2699430 RepID=A0A6G7VH18_9GAMM|nr:segregation/condensation protein A [Caldichromatium japonicum]QIK39176.1 segregation/condensation protein A [Caldichromatium japonicum]